MVIRKVKCLRCGHEWFPRTEVKPRSCSNPECRSIYWDKPKRAKTRYDVPEDNEIELACLNFEAVK